MQNRLQIKERDYKVLQQKMENIRIEIEEKRIELIKASNALESKTATLTQRLEVIRIEIKQVIEENNNLRYTL
jgi:hypothetical protein